MAPYAHTSFLLSLFLIGCATVDAPRPPSVPLDLPAVSNAAVGSPRVTAADRAVRATPVTKPDRSTVVPVIPGERAEGNSSYTMLKVGPFYGRGDLDGLDTGIWGEVVFGRELLPFLAIEGMVGYFQADDSGAVKSEIWGIPVMAQARAKIPVAILEPYAGVGLGGMYVDAEAGPFYDETDFVFASSVFAGAAVGLGNLSVGIEGKYVATDEVNGDFRVEGASAFAFVSLPF